MSEGECRFSESGNCLVHLYAKYEDVARLPAICPVAADALRAKVADWDRICHELARQNARVIRLESLLATRDAQVGAMREALDELWKHAYGIGPSEEDRKRVSLLVKEALSETPMAGFSDVMACFKAITWDIDDEENLAYCDKGQYMALRDAFATLASGGREEEKA